MRLSSVLLILVGVWSHTDALSLSGSRQRAVGFLAHVGAAVCAGSEVLEDVKELGHGHGILLLECSKLCREANLFRESVQEESEELKQNVGNKKWVMRPIAPIARGWRMVFNTKISAILATAALGAAVAEVIEDSRPGGHHGAVFLAVSELLELLTDSRLVKWPFWAELIANQALRLTLALGAVALALVETVSSSKQAVGAHHAVFILALSKTLRCTGLLLGEKPHTEPKVA